VGELLHVKFAIVLKKIYFENEFQFLKIGPGFGTIVT
jgi:hypothetical protein